MSREKIYTGAKTFGVMFAGALTLAAMAFIIWAIANLDVMTKAVRYPEAIRQMQIEVRISQPEE